MKQVLRIFCSLVLCLWPAAHGLGQPTSAPQATDEHASSATYEPTANYQVENIAGWNVYFHRRLLADRADLAAQVRAEVARQLNAIVQAVPRDKVELLRKSKIWVEHFHPKFPCACYHPSTGWLKENNFNPEKVDSVDISNPQNFVDWSLQQPSMLLHELAHGYHDQVLGHDHAGIRRAYERAQQGDIYEKVKHENGDTVRHYALTNDQEYFAETTEAYFGTNDFYPFVRAELRKFDPEGFALMQELWEQ